MRRNTAAVSSLASTTVTQSDPKKIDERGDHAECSEDPGQPGRGMKKLVHPPPPQKSKADGDRKHPADRPGIDQLPGVATLRFFRLVVIARHSEESPRARRPIAKIVSPGSPAAPVPRRKSA